MAEPKFVRDNGCKEAVCVDAGRVYDSCCEGYPTSTKRVWQKKPPSSREVARRSRDGGSKAANAEQNTPSVLLTLDRAIRKGAFWCKTKRRNSSNSRGGRSLTDAPRDDAVSADI